mgnify:CR=1 FL=1
MIFVAAGTQDGRELTEALVWRGHSVTASVVSRYGEQLLAACGNDNLTIHDEPLDEDGFVAYIRAHAIRAFVDASHPYAVNVSKNAMAACHVTGTPYIRYERALSALGYAKIHVVHGYEEAAERAAQLGAHVFLTTGSRNLEKFTQAEALKPCTLTARVLPTADVVALCERLSLTPGQIVALQGPFSTALNAELFKKYRADVIVTKNSGAIGGTDTKIEAARELEIPVVLIDRPVLAYDTLARTYEEVIRFVEEN